MTAYIALLRGINVGGRHKLPMAALRTICADMGLDRVETYIQSGNLVFEGEDGAAIIASQLGTAIKQAFDYDIPVQVWSCEDWAVMVGANPFADEKNIEPKNLHATFLDGVPDTDAARQALEAVNTSERFLIVGRAVYLFCPQGYGRAKLTNGVIEKKLGLSATTRNWRTVGILNDLARQRLN
jgi:uncharacterized protein (DUF1697 family)